MARNHAAPRLSVINRRVYAVLGAIESNDRPQKSTLQQPSIAVDGSHRSLGTHPGRQRILQRPRVAYPLPLLPPSSTRTNVAFPWADLLQEPDDLTNADFAGIRWLGAPRLEGGLS